MFRSASFSSPENIFQYSVSNGSSPLCVPSRVESRGVSSDGTVAVGI